MAKKKCFLIFLLAFLLTGCVLNSNSSKEEVHNNSTEVLSLPNSTGNPSQHNEKSCNWGYELIMNGHSPAEKDQKKVSIAILDSGINQTHIELQGKIIDSFNTVESENHEDFLNHGTAVAAIIAGENKEKGICGIFPTALIYDVRILDKNGNGNVDNLVEGLEWAIEQDVDIINISVGTSESNPKLEKAVNEANKKGIIIIASSGNKYGLSADYPAKYDSVISVGSIGEDLKKSVFGVSGKVDFVAPGEDIKSIDNNGEYVLYSGTSFSTAFVTGVVANLLSQNSYPDNKTKFTQVYSDLKSMSVLPSQTENVSKFYGNGIVKFKK
ncbi:S8 family serine peptidase [Aeribacillus sp. FSL W8-0870]|uniref:S8 family serine peptidase n=1 Tax=Aeribacillus sp. FSL W8-0870 TaxID=2954706 RepID=UPI0030D187ED